MALSQGIATSKTTTSGNVTTTAVTTTSGSTVVVLFMEDGGSFTSVTDNKGNTYTRIGSSQSLSSYPSGTGHVFYCSNIVGGSGHTFTGTATGGGWNAILVTEVLGADAASFDVTAQRLDTSSPFTVTSPTTSQADEMLVALVGIAGTGGNANASESTGFTVVASQPDYSYMQGAVATRVVSSTGAYTPSFTITNTSDTMLWIATFKAAGSTDYPLTADSGSFALTGADAGLLGGRVLTSGAGSFALTGSDATLTYTPLSSYSLAADAGSYALTGADAGLVAARSVSAATGAFVLTGGATTRIVARKLVAASRAFVLSGKVATLTAARTVAAAAGSYALTGADATLVYSPVGSYTLVADGGSYALAGTDATLIYVPAQTAVGGGSYEAAAAEWERSQKWQKEAQKLLFGEPEAAPKAKTKKSTTQAAQDAPRRPRKAEPAPIQPASTAALDGLLARSYGPALNRLQQAMAARELGRIVQAAMAAEAQILADEEAVIELLLLEVA